MHLSSFWETKRNCYTLRDRGCCQESPFQFLSVTNILPLKGAFSKIVHSKLNAYTKHDADV